LKQPAPSAGWGRGVAQYAIEQLKRRLPVWKEEHLAGAPGRFVEGVPLELAS